MSVSTPNLTKWFLFLSTMLFLSVNLYAQGVTTSSMSGIVMDVHGEALAGATVIAVHEPTGTEYGVSTRVDGRYNLQNVRVGGPYHITVTYVGYKEQEMTDVHLNLGQEMKIDFNLQEQAFEGEAIVVTADKDDILSSDRNGASTIISSQKIDQMPTISRSTGDLTRLTPQNDGNSYGGRNVLYNNFSLDGSIFNNPFGLDSPVPGGQTNAQPVSLDAIDQIQVSLAPFDVRQGGFTGAGVNSVTKSGTNEFTGSAYTFTRNEGMIGDQVSGTTVTNPDLSYNQSGFRIGGPLIKNKLFFFVNGEIERREDPGSNYVASRPGLSGSNVSNVLASDLDVVSERLQDVYGYETGAYENYIHETQNDKFLAKLDWNINANHSASLRYNYLSSWRDVSPHPAISTSGRGPDKNALPFENTSYIINNDINSVVGELNSRFGNKYSNHLQFGYTSFRDYRDSKSEPFPSVDIEKDGRTYISFGLERFSTNNLLDQDVFQLTDNFNVYHGDHLLTIGTHYELFKFNNSFNLFYYPGYTYSSVEDFLAHTDPTDPAMFNDFNADVDNSNQNPFKMDETDVAQLAFYIQDEWQFSNRLMLSIGMRTDMPIYYTDIPENSVIESYDWVDENGNPANLDVSKLPDSTPLLSPRIGFNWDATGDRSAQLRGGTGVFTGRIPFVWVGNQVANSTITPYYTFQINGTAKDFKFPQVWKTDLAVDKSLPWGVVGTVEAIYSKDINAVVHRNYNMPQPTEHAVGADNREIFAAPTAENFEPFKVNSIVDGSYLDAGAIVLDNTDEGYQFSFTTQLRKVFANGLFSSIAYNYGLSKDLTSSRGEIAADAFQQNPIVGDPNDPELSYSDYGLTHRFVGVLSYKKEYKKNFATSVAVFFEAAQGDRFSFTYAGDMNRDGISGNDLIYVPKDQSEINLVPTDASDTRTEDEIWNQLNAYINQDDYLKDRRGDYAERNGALSPWYTQMDLRILQDFYVNIGGKKNTFQLSLDILNVANFINSDWGVREIKSTETPLSFEGYNASGEPIYSFPLYGGEPLSESFNDDTSLDSRWRAQIGLRYIF
ncbi:MAG: TonB-dependent receptor [Calditrichaceae bacterium]